MQFADAQAEIQIAPEALPLFERNDQAPRWEDALAVRVITEPAAVGNVGARLVLVPGAATESEGLTFYARSMWIDNPTAQWWHVTNTDQWVEPYTLGMIIPLAGPQQIRILNENPPGGRFTSATVANERGAVRVYDRDMMPAPGRKIAAIAGGAPGWLVGTV